MLPCRKQKTWKMRDALQEAKSMENEGRLAGSKKHGK